MAEALNNGMSLRDALRVATELGCILSKRGRHGGFKVTHPAVKRVLTIGERPAKDAPRHLIGFLRDVQTAGLVDRSVKAAEVVERAWLGKSPRRSLEAHHADVVEQVQPPAPIAVDNPMGDVAFEVVTPAMAAKWLESNHPKNRQISNREVSAYAADMKAGRWWRNYQPVMFDSSGQLVDGQHRLWAIVEADVPVELMVVRNQPGDVMMTVDKNRPRQLKHWLRMTGGSAYDVHATALGHLWEYRRAGTVGQGAKTSREKPTQPELIALGRAEPGLEASAMFVSGSRVRHLAAKGMLATLHYLFSEVDPERTARFFAALAGGVDLRADSGVARLLQILNDERARRGSRARRTNREIGALIVKAWNADREGRPVLALRFGRDEAFPDIR